MKIDYVKTTLPQPLPTKDVVENPHIASGKDWDNNLSERIMNREKKQITDSSPQDEKAAEALIGAVESTDFDGKHIKVIHSHFFFVWFHA